jgi:hypothetical protein
MQNGFVSATKANFGVVWLLVGQFGRGGGVGFKIERRRRLARVALNALSVTSSLMPSEVLST